MSTALQRLLWPKSVAVIGGGAWCASVVAQCRLIGFDGPIWAVHPDCANIGGVVAVARVEDLPGAPDAVFIGINRHALIATLPALNAIGAGGAVCFASGFLETGEAGLQADLLAAAGEMALIGPNCYGFINYLDRCALWPDQHGGAVVESGVAILTQSSNIAQNLTMQTRGLPIAFIATAGNQAQTGLADIGAALLDDPRITALGCYVEGFGALDNYEALAKRANDLGKRVVILKAGRSSHSKVALVSHTASLAGGDAGAQAFMERLGFIRVETLTQMVETLKLLHVHGDLTGAKVASLSCSGGEASLIADAAKGVSFPPLGKVRSAALAPILGEMVNLTNPLDYHTGIWRDAVAMRAVFAAMSGPEYDVTLLIIDMPRGDRCNSDDWHVAIDALIAAAQNGRPYGVVASLPEGMPEALAARLIKHGIVPFSSIDDALFAINAVAQAQAPAAEPVLSGPAPAQTMLISEASAKAELARFGIAVPDGHGGVSAQETAIAAQKLGFPVVLKGEGMAHKSDAGAVALGLADKGAVRAATAKMNADSFLVEAVIPDAVTELLVGVTLDPAHGYTLTLGAGGVLSELLDDVQTLLIPANETAIHNALDRLRIAPLLAGYRGKPGANMRSIVAVVMAIQAYVIAKAGKVTEVEINPLLCTPTRAVAVDALIIRKV